MYSVYIVLKDSSHKVIYKSEIADDVGSVIYNITNDVEKSVVAVYRARGLTPGSGFESMHDGLVYGISCD